MTSQQHVKMPVIPEPSLTLLAVRFEWDLAKVADSYEEG